MRMTTALITFSVAVLLSGCGVDGHERPLLPPRNPDAFSEGERFGEAVKAAVSDASSSDLEQLVAGGDCSVALAAAWEQLRRSIAVPQDGEVRVSKADAERFLRLVEGRLGIDVPSAWEQAVLATTLRDDGSTVFYVVAELEAWAGSPGRPKVDRSGDRLDITRPGQHWRVQTVSKSNWDDNASVVTDEGTLFLALYGSATYPYPLYSLNDGDVAWTATVFASQDYVAYSGPNLHRVILVTSESGVTVFGISGGVIYVEAFDRETGRALCRFSSRARELAMSLLSPYL
jgi:hypothetical protein